MGFLGRRKSDAYSAGDALSVFQALQRKRVRTASCRRDGDGFSSTMTVFLHPQMADSFRGRAECRALRVVTRNVAAAA
jgi:hypothetical protein